MTALLGGFLRDCCNNENKRGAANQTGLKIYVSTFYLFEVMKNLILKGSPTEGRTQEVKCSKI